MIKKIFFLFGVLICGIFTTTNANLEKPETDRKPVKSCIDLSNQFEKLIKNGTPLPSPLYTENHQVSTIDLGTEKSESNTFLTTFDEKTHILTVIQWPKSFNSPLVDLTKVKKIARITIPQDFKALQINRYNNTLILSANHEGKSWKSETVVLFYEILDNKITPVHYFAQSGKRVYLWVQNEKLYLITNENTTSEQIATFIKQRQAGKNFFPTLNEGVGYGLGSTKQKAVSCQDLQTLFTPQELPQFRTMISVDLKNLKATKERHTFLGSFNQFIFSKNHLYAATTTPSQETRLQIFWLEPKINYQRSVLLSGEIIDHAFFSNQNKVGIITKRSSGKFHNYLVSELNGQTSKLQQQEIWSWTTEYSHGTLLWETLLLETKNKDWMLITLNGETAPIPLSTKKEEQLFLLDEAPLSLLKIREEKGKVLFSFLSLSWTLIESSPTTYPGTSKLLGTPIRNQAQRLLLLPINIEKDGKSFQGIKGIQPSSKAIKENFSREYKSNTEPTFDTGGILPDFSFIISNNLIDLFVQQSPEKMKILKRD